MRGIGGDFKADSSLGHPTRLSDYKDYVVLLTFGYTNCPDVCPITLGYLNFLVSKLNKDQQQKVKVIFITVDPEYDTPAYLKKYLAAFNPSFIGISPTEENLVNIAKQFQVVYEKVKDFRLATQYNRPSVKERDKNDTSNVFNHSISIFLIDKKNKVRAVHYSGYPSDKFIKEILTLLEQPNNKQLRTIQNSKIIAQNFWLKNPTKYARVTALYGTIINQSSQTIQLHGISCPSLAKNSELHLSRVVNSQMNMIKQDNIPIKPQQHLVLKPLSYHAMLFGLLDFPAYDNQVNCILKFDNNINKKVIATIKNFDAFINN